MSGKGQGRETLPALRSLGPVTPPHLVIPVEKAKGPFAKKGKVARSPPAALTPPFSEREVTEDPDSGGVAMEIASYPGQGMSSDDRMLAALLARMGEVLTAQGTVQQVLTRQQGEFRTQHGEFQASVAEVLKSHDNQLAAQVATQQSLVTQMGVSTSC